MGKVGELVYESVLSWTRPGGAGAIRRPRWGPEFIASTDRTAGCRLPAGLHRDWPPREGPSKGQSKPGWIAACRGRSTKLPAVERRQPAGRLSPRSEEHT